MSSDQLGYTRKFCLENLHKNNKNLSEGISLSDKRGCNQKAVDYLALLR